MEGEMSPSTARGRKPRLGTKLTLLLLLVIPVTAQALPERAAGAPSRPNIILLLTDDQTYDSLSAMQFVNSNPAGHWVWFNEAVATTPLCCPSRATVLTGQYPHHHGVKGNNDGPRLDEQHTLATWLDTAGYHTGLFGKYLNSYPFGRGDYTPPGWDDWHAFDSNTPKMGDIYDFTLIENGQRNFYARPLNSTFVLADKLGSFIRAAPQPFFGYWAPFAPHLPAHVPKSYSGWCATPGNTLPLGPNFNEADVSDKPGWIRNRARLTSSQESVQRANKCKAFTSLQVVDDAIERIFQALQDSGRLENTVVVLTTDNGYSFGAHRYDKKGCAYEECVRAPIGVRYPWGPLNSREDGRAVGTVDLAMTFTELAGSTPDIPQDGSSFVPLLDQQAVNWRQYAMIEMARKTGPPGFYGVRDSSWKYVELDTGEKELYDLRNDPYELLNRAGDPNYSTIRATLAAELQRLKN
jgi:arylsulfatase A-like enzyme